MPSTRPTSEYWSQLNRRLQVARKDDGNRVLAIGVRRGNSCSKPEIGCLFRKSAPTLSCADLEVEAVDKEIAEAWKFADVPLNSPCSLIDLGPAVPSGPLVWSKDLGCWRLVWDAWSKGEIWAESPWEESFGQAVAEAAASGERDPGAMDIRGSHPP